MATLSRADIATVLNLLFADEIYEQSRRDIVALHFLEVKDDANATCTWRVKFDARTAGGPYAEGADMADGDFDANSRVQASLNWAQYRKGAKVSGLAQAISQANGATAMNGDVFMEEIRDAVDALALELGGDLYGGNPAASPVELAGADLATDGTAGTFAGIASGTYGDWIAIEDTTTEAALSKQVIREKLLIPVKQAGGYRPDVVTVADDIWENVVALADEGVGDVKEITVNGQTVNIIAMTGCTGVYIDGVPFINDRHATAGTMYAWNFRFVHVKQVPAIPRSAANPARLVANIKALTGVDITVEDVEARLRKMNGRLQPVIEILAQTGDAYKAMVKWYGQIAWAKRNAFGKLTVT